jgi:hypothetical protein
MCQLVLCQQTSILFGEKGHITSDQIYTRFWIDLHKVSPFVCSIRDTPHYSFAREVLSKAFPVNFLLCPKTVFTKSIASGKPFALMGIWGIRQRVFTVTLPI